MIVKSAAKKGIKRGLLLATIVLIATLAAGAALAQEPTRVVTDDEVNAIAKDLFCPVCESTPLDVCATQACADWREVIRTKLSQGETEDEIRAYFERQYGPRALSEPPREGFTLAAWIGPIAIVLIGAVLFGRYLQRLRVGQQPGPATAAETAGAAEPVMDDYQARIERELKEL
jgi:cytochrome c-type biogenesis protein CcmH